LGTTVAQDRSSGGGLHVLNPGHVDAEHRDEISMAVNDGHHERKGDWAPGTTSDHFQHDEVVRCDPAREHGGCASIDPARQRIGPVSPVEPAGELSQHLRELRGVRYWITWSARSSTDCGIVRPRALAVFRLITNSEMSPPPSANRLNKEIAGRRCF